MLHYIGTRGEASPKNFEEILLAGLAENGGLYVPQQIPRLSQNQINALRGLSYQELALAVTYPFIDGAIPKNDYREMLARAYTRFRHKEITPLTPISTEHTAPTARLYGLELFHGDTLAFKDIALSLLGELFEYACEKRDLHMTILGATSGDTGPAAMSAFANREHSDIFMLYPYSRTSEVQRRQMTTLRADNAHPIAMRGSFDDCQDIVKSLLRDESLRERFHLSAVNSINWARIMAQIPYYAYASLRFDEPIDICVPTGNFGNILAAYCARAMGFAIGDLIIASNENDILTRFIASNDMSMREVRATWSPSIDIQIPSNFERLLFWLCGGDSANCVSLMEAFRSGGSLPLAEPLWKQACSIFSAYSVSDAETLAIIGDFHARSGVLYDPHSAVALGSALRHVERHVEARGENGDVRPIVVALTAHAAKFSEATLAACGEVLSLPAGLDSILAMDERTIILDSDIGIVRDYIERFGFRG